MTEATWGDGAKTPAIEWRMSAALENVPRNGEDFAEVTSLRGAVLAWRELDLKHRAAAVLTPEHAILIDGVAHVTFGGDAIGALGDLLTDEDKGQS